VCGVGQACAVVGAWQVCVWVLGGGVWLMCGLAGRVFGGDGWGDEAFFRVFGGVGEVGLCPCEKTYPFKLREVPPAAQGEPKPATHAGIHPHGDPVLGSPRLRGEPEGGGHRCSSRRLCNRAGSPVPPKSDFSNILAKPLDKTP